ncbi:hypothetical protein BDZ89DRAFT_1049589 [Hymenopellis radicata]|nr:hypothetical protein BDZ89DRAFT_1049589 [Hymenopellis radicata]
MASPPLSPSSTPSRSPSKFPRVNLSSRLNLTTKPLILARSLGRKPTSKATLFVPKKLTQQTLTFTKASTKSAFLCRKRLEQHVRVRRPIRADYELGNGVQALRGPVDSLDAKPDPHFVKAAETRFIHDDVGHFLAAYDASQLEMKFKAMGIYTHEDLVTVAVDIRTNQSLRQEFKMGLETTDAVWRRLKAGLYRYARPAKAPPLKIVRLQLFLAREFGMSGKHKVSLIAHDECRTCCLKRHERAPVHAIQVWRDATWQTISLREIGLVYQLGHQGARCPVPDATPHIMTVMHVNGVHQVEMRYCDCTSKFKLKIVRLQLFLAREFGITPVGPMGPPVYSRRPFNSNEERTFGVVRAKRIVQRALAEFHSPSASGMSEDGSANVELVAMFEELQGEWLITRLEACHIVSKEELAHLGWLSYNRQFATVFRLALGLSLSGGNWPRLAHLMREFTEPRSTYETVEGTHSSHLFVNTPGVVTYDTGCQFIWTAMREHNDRERAFDRAFDVERNEADAEEQELPDRGDRDGREDNKILGDRGNRMALGPSVVEYYDYSVYIAWGSLVRERPSLMQASRNPGGRPRANPVFSRPANAPAVHDHSIHIDHAGRVSSQAVPNVDHSDGRRPSDLQDEYAQAEFEPLLPPEPIYAQDDRDHDDIDSEQEEEEEEDAGGNNDTTEGGTAKRKRYASSDQPMEEWKPWLTAFLEETIRRHGLGNATRNPRCSSCDRRLKAECIGIAIERPSTEAGDVDECEELFRCQSCGDFLECQACCLRRHDRAPVHAIQVWREATWQTISLRDMGLVYQLGHQGARCRVPDPTPHIMTVMHVNGVHQVEMRYCGCSVSDGETSLAAVTTERTVSGYNAISCHLCDCRGSKSVIGVSRTIATVNVRDFVTTLEDQTDPYGTSWTPDRYKAFLRMARQWHFCREFDDRVSVMRDGDWRRRRTARFEWNAGHVLGMPNFRMRCKMRSSPYVDLPLYDGLGVQMPTELYHEWLRKYITEEEISSCVAFAALMQKDTRFSVGLRWAGVIGVICARHEIMLGLGDLEKGERYKNTDFVLYWVLSKMGLKEVTVTYDIACQYRKHFKERIEALPDVLKNLDLPEIQWGLPIWHGGAHEISCETAESLKYKEGVGKTDGEGIERVWSVLNPMSYMTREEQPGARHDDIEDKVDKHNFGKNIHLGRTLLKRLRIALQEKEVQVKGFDVVDEALDDDVRSDWMGMVVDWLKDPAKPNPYAPSEKGAESSNSRTKSEKKTKPKRKKAGSTGMRVTMSAFLIMGLQLEDAFTRLRNERARKENLTTEQQSKVYERRRTQMAKLKVFRKWQDVYMPWVTKIIEKEEVDRRSRSAAVPPVEDARLYLPSECAKSQELDRKRYLVYFRNEHVRGQREGGRAATTLSTMATKLKESVAKYRHCRDRLVALVGEAGCGPFRVLEDEDVKVYQTAESDEDAVRKLSRLEARNSRVTGDSVSARLKKTKRRDVPGETRAVMSWIWTAEGGPDANEDGYLHECVRIEWAKALARKTRWTEEVEILKEEMRRVLRSLRFEEQRWMFRAEKDYHGLRLEEIAGRKAYARRQARDRRRVRESFETLWGMTRPARGQKAGPKDGEAQRAAAAIITQRKARVDTYLRRVAHQALCYRVDRVEYEQFSNTWQGQSAGIVTWEKVGSVPDVPEPRMRAVLDSFPFPDGGGSPIAMTISTLHLAYISHTPSQACELRSRLVEVMALDACHVVALREASSWLFGRRLPSRLHGWWMLFASSRMAEALRLRASVLFAYMLMFWLPKDSWIAQKSTDVTGYTTKSRDGVSST